MINSKFTIERVGEKIIFINILKNRLITDDCNDTVGDENRRAFAAEI